MSSIEVPRMQCLVGLSIMFFCTLAFHACSQSLYTTPTTPLTSNLPPTPSPDLTPSQFSTLMEALTELSKVVEGVNTSLHARIDHEFSLLQKTSSWRQNQSQEMGPEAIVALGDTLFALTWLVSAGVVCNGMYEIGKKFMWRVLLVAVWCANGGLLAVVLGTEGVRWYGYVMAAVWPMQVVVAVRVWLVGEKEGERREKEKKEKEKVVN